MGKDILILDSNKNFVDNLNYTLNKKDYILDHISTINELMKKINEKDYDLLILEKTKKINGIDICKKIRESSIIPIIILSSIDDEISKVLAFECGADDFLVKPFNISELKARMMTIFRRMEYKIQEKPKHIIYTNNLTIDLLKRVINIRDKNINLTGKEFDLFYVLSSNPGKIFTREELLNKIWGQNNHSDIRTVDVHIRRIREKIEKTIKDRKYIMTKWGEGYYFKAI